MYVVCIILHNCICIAKCKNLLHNYSKCYAINCNTTTVPLLPPITNLLAPFGLYYILLLQLDYHYYDNGVHIYILW